MATLSTCLIFKLYAILVTVKRLILNNMGQPNTVVLHLSEYKELQVELEKLREMARDRTIYITITHVRPYHAGFFGDGVLIMPPDIIEYQSKEESIKKALAVHDQSNENWDKERKRLEGLIINKDQEIGDLKEELVKWKYRTWWEVLTKKA